jgi:outer membrane receptor for ferrienterochelin and colicin
MKKSFLVLYVVLQTCYSGRAQEQMAIDSLYDLSLEQLMNIEVTSVSKKAERLQDVTSSIYVLTSDDILKTGATTIHELLRTVPGYWGAQDEYSSTVSGMRVSRTQSAEDGTVLYLLDGTPIQNLINSSFSFRNFDIPLSNIERIEVIRGSGGSVYGANSATGVVNIFTKNPEDYKGIQTTIEGAAPGYAAASVSASGALSKKFSASAYGKVRYFSGFESMTGVDENGNQTVESSRFKKNYDESTMSSFGLKLNYALSDQTRLSMRSHFNMLNKYDYSHYITENSLDLLTSTITNDVLVEKKVNSNRLVSNIRLDHSFSESHSLFVRVSTNRENDYSKLSGGYEVSNAIYDFEAQDNLSLGSSNDLSFGANYRMVQFDIHDIEYTNGINYDNPQSTESLKGAFIQNKTKFFNGKLNMTLGLKAENYSLLNDEFYLSPMAKISYLPTKNLTLWGGYTQSYTTPGLNMTNIDLYLFQTPPIETWTAIASQAIYGQVYNTAYQAAIAAGASPDAAAGAGANAANNFVASPQGQATISATATSLQARTPNVAVRNGDHTTPTQFQTWEFGVRANIAQQWTLETNLFYTNISDGFDASLTQQPNQESRAQPGRFATYITYGNYVKGVSKGAESMIRFRPSGKVFFELAHTYLESTWEYQENADFDINDPAIVKDQTPETPEMPEHIFKFRSSIDIAKGLNVNLGFIYASKFATQSTYRFNDERYPVLTFPEDATVIAKNNTRTIVNLRVEKKMMNNNLSIYAFGNDIFNKGMIEDTNNIYNTTLSKIGAMYGVGIIYVIAGK